MDMESEKVANNLGLIEVNTTTAQEHVRLIEGGIHKIKECVRIVIEILPLKSLHK